MYLITFEVFVLFLGREFRVWVELCPEFGHLAAISDAIYNLMAGNELSTSQLATVDIVTLESGLNVTRTDIGR